LAQALERQTATAEILKVIASSPTDVQPVFQAIADNAKRVLGGRSAFVARYVADMAHLAAFTSTDPETDAVARASWPRPMVGNPIVEAVQNGRIFQVADIETVPDSGLFRTAARQGWRSALTAPLATKGMTIGSITVTRSEPGVFAADDVQLMRTFADQAVIAIENTRLFNETKEALERQTATADVLGAIGRSVSDAAPVFEEILNACQRLFGSEEMGIYTVGADEMVRVAAWRGPRALEVSKDVSPLADSITGKMIRERRTHHIPDLREEPNLSPMVRERAERLGSASLLYAPMLREDRGLGSILVVRAPPRPFTERETELLRTFADQAAIAIENARLFNETQEALERQTATAEILKVIASSPTDVQPVFQAIADSAKRLLAGHSALVTRYMDGLSHIAAFTPISPEADAALAASYPRPLKGNPTYEAVRDGFPFKLPDVEEADPEGMRKQARGRGWRSLTALPLLNRGAVIGAIAVTRAAPGALADEDIQLLRTFADQAEIAIENTRLFNETQEALNQQTATADVLKVISRSVFDLDTVLQTLIDTAVRLTRGSRGTIFLRQDDVLVARAFHSNVPGELRAYLAATTWRLDGDSHMARAARERVVVHVADLSQSQIESDKQVQKRASFGAGLWTPLMREGEVIGVFGVPRDEPIAFTDREIELIQTFADQAVIAIENSRLFEQVQAKTRDLQAAFERQKATADILRVISASPTDVTPVFAAIVETAVRLIGCYSAMVFRVEGDKLAPVTGAGRSGPLDELSPPVPIDPENNFPSRAVVSKETYHVPDYSAIELSEFERQIQDVIAPPSALFLPFVREGECIGLMALAGDRPHAFGAEDIALAESFRDQALIAIENARLFNETQESLQQQTATADVLKVISRSAFDLDAVLDTLVSSAGKLCGADGGIIWLRQGEKLHAGATFGYSPEATGFFKANPRGLGDKSLAPRVMRSGRTEHIPRQVARPGFFVSRFGDAGLHAWRSLVSWRRDRGAFSHFPVCARRRSARVRSNSSKPSPIRPSLRSRTRGYSTRCRRARATWRSRSHSRPPPPTC
jgi:GAF domain-containing protein